MALVQTAKRPQFTIADIAPYLPRPEYYREYFPGWDTDQVWIWGRHGLDQYNNAVGRGRRDPSGEERSKYNDAHPFQSCLGHVFGRITEGYTAACFGGLEVLSSTDAPDDGYDLAVLGTPLIGVKWTSGFHTRTRRPYEDHEMHLRIQREEAERVPDCHHVLVIGDWERTLTPRLAGWLTNAEALTYPAWPLNTLFTGPTVLDLRPIEELQAIVRARGVDGPMYLPED